MSANMHKTFGGENETKAKLAGLLGGTRVLTVTGYVQIEELKAGDKIITRNGLRSLKALHVEQCSMRPILVSQGTLGFNRPTEAMYMAPGQEVMVRDWRAEMLFGRDMVIVNIDTIVDGKYIAQHQVAAMHDIYQLHFDEAEIFYADGVEVVADYEAAMEAELLLEAA